MCSSPKRSASISLELAAEPVAVGVRLDEHVRRERGEAAADLPDVQVVHLGHVRVARHRAADLVDVEVRRRHLEQHAARVAEQPDGGAEHERGDEQRGDRVGAVEAGRRGSRRRRAPVSANATRSVRMCWNEPSMFIDSRFAFASCCVTSAVHDDADERDDERSRRPSGSGGVISRWIAP